jgi:F-type H+-transporting ATPase subunit c
MMNTDENIPALSGQERTMNKYTKWIPVATVVTFALLFSNVALAAGDEYKGYVGLGAGLAMGLAVIGGGIGQGMAARGMYESISRNPSAAGKLNAPFYVGMALIESLVLYALVIAFFLQGYIA